MVKKGKFYEINHTFNTVGYYKVTAVGNMNFFIAKGIKIEDNHIHITKKTLFMDTVSKITEISEAKYKAKLDEAKQFLEEAENGTT